MTFRPTASYRGIDIHHAIIEHFYPSRGGLSELRGREQCSEILE